MLKLRWKHIAMLSANNGLFRRSFALLVNIIAM